MMYINMDNKAMGLCINIQTLSESKVCTNSLIAHYFQRLLETFQGGCCQADNDIMQGSDLTEYWYLQSIGYVAAV